MLQIAVLILVSLSQIQTATYFVRQTSRTGDEKEGSINVPFDATNNLFAINATINDQGPYRFVIDSGSSEYFISRETANALGLKSMGTARVDVGREKMIDAEQTNIAELK